VVIALAAFAALALNHHAPLHAAESSGGIAEKPITDADRNHWSFRPLTRPAVPKVNDSRWPRNAIDAFILARLEEKGLAPLPEADRVTLIRRLSIDLVGLPPTVQQVDAFVSDTSPDAHERLVDRLLDSPGYGERWAQHWLDLARFAETDGFEHDKVRADVWRYRDWVIAALNADMPYDRFVQMQLAGDELRPDDPEARAATAFCLSGPDMPDINSQVERKSNLLDEMTSTVGAVFLGLQVGCAKCHDHKYDPISQADFYRMRAVFANAVHVRANQSVFALEEKSADAPASHLLIRGDWQNEGPEVEPAFPRIANPWEASIPEPAAGAATTDRRLALARWLTRPDHPLAMRVIANRLWQFHFGEGLSRSPSDFGVMGQAPSHPQLLDWLATELPRRGFSLKAMHRLIVTSATYRLASRPDQPGWTDAQRADARARWDRAKEVDPANEYLARAPMQRMEGEVIRDAMLAAADRLSRQTGGPGVRPPLPDELVGTLLKDQWKVSPDDADHLRRSIYVFARRNLRYPLFEAFDRPDANASCPRRNQSTTAPQALWMFNAAESLDAARHLAGRVLEEAASDRDEQVRAGFRRLFSRTPTPEELAAARDFLEQQQALLESQDRRADELAMPPNCPPEVQPEAAAALVDLCLALLNTSEFIYVD
jgi:hypothetical protein